MVVSARLLRDATAITHELPTAALGDRFGGPIVTDPADAAAKPGKPAAAMSEQEQLEAALRLSLGATETLTAETSEEEALQRAIAASMEM